MGRPLFFVENLLSARTFPDHVLTASSTEAGLDVRFVATGRRQYALNRWAPSTTNTDAYVQAVFDRVRTFDTLAIDRDHNLGGYTVQVRVSSDAAFSSYSIAASATIPTRVYPYSRLSDGGPVLTEEGAVLWKLGTWSGLAVQLYVPAMGAGLKPEIVGAAIGRAWQPQHAVQRPFTHGQIRLVYQEEQSPEGWSAAGTIAKLRTGSPGLKLERSEYDQARYHIEELFFDRKPMWLAMDDEEAEKARNVVAPPGEAGFEIPLDGWSGWQGEIPWIENEPRIVGPVR